MTEKEDSDGGARIQNDWSWLKILTGWAVTHICLIPVETPWRKQLKKRQDSVIASPFRNLPITDYSNNIFMTDHEIPIKRRLCGGIHWFWANGQTLTQLQHICVDF